MSAHGRAVFPFNHSVPEKSRRVEPPTRLLLPESAENIPGTITHCTVPCPWEEKWTGDFLIFATR